jgi:hypothetical protein
MTLGFAGSGVDFGFVMTLGFAGSGVDFGFVMTLGFAGSGVDFGFVITIGFKIDFVLSLICLFLSLGILCFDDCIYYISIN